MCLEMPVLVLDSPSVQKSLRYPTLTQSKAGSAPLTPLSATLQFGAFCLEVVLKCCLGLCRHRPLPGQTTYRQFDLHPG